MKAAIFYFSGTGNTRKIAELYRSYFNNDNIECDLFPLPNKNHIDLKEYNYIGFGYPVHAFNAPELLLDFARSLPILENQKRCFIFKTSGEPVKMNRISSLKLIKILKTRGYIVKNEYHYCMPYNIIFRHTDNMAFKLWEAAKKLVPIDYNELIQEKEHYEKKVFFGSALAWFLRIEHPGARFNGKFYKIEGNCIGCGKCATNCPVNNIKMNENKLPEFGKDCLMCMRCSFFCPKNSIKIGLFNSWRVNGEYSFKPGNPDEKSKHDNYCKKAYDRYFEYAENRNESIDDDSTKIGEKTV